MIQPPAPLLMVSVSYPDAPMRIGVFLFLGDVCLASQRPVAVSMDPRYTMRPSYRVARWTLKSKREGSHLL